MVKTASKRLVHWLHIP